MKKALMILIFGLFLFARCGPVFAAASVDAAKTAITSAVPAQDAVMAEEATTIVSPRPAELQVLQVGDTVTVIVNGQEAKFYVPQNSKTGRALSYGGVTLAFLLSIFAWLKANAAKAKNR